ADQQGAALIIALMAMMLLTALGATVFMVSRTETAISNNYRDSQEALYAADAAIERVVQDLLMVPRWNNILAGSVTSSFTVGNRYDPLVLPAGGQTTLDTATCPTAPSPPGSATCELQRRTDEENLWGTNNPKWRLFAWGPLSELLSTATIDSRMYVAVWVADDPADGPDLTNPDGDPLLDSNGVLTIRAEAIGVRGTRKTIEVTVARTSGTEIERGQIAQRGQEELNQRARKAAVQTPGKSLNNMRMSTATGGLQ
ncbi:MAG: pilus assembly PilX N-terminal domain-containing protein, partial [Vicinamibacterales bacterium]